MGWNLVWPTLVLRYLPCLEFSSKYEDEKTHIKFPHWKLEEATSNYNQNIM